MNLFARTVLGYHGCTKQFADALLSGNLSMNSWKPSQNDFDWLGHGIYFWEHAPARAWRWAEEKAKKTGAAPAVVGAIIQLGDCFDLTNEANTANLAIAYQFIKETYQAADKELPQNKGKDDDLKGRFLDCLVINDFLKKVSEVRYQTVRGAFREGQPAYDGAMIYQETHVQVAVIDTSCVLGVFRPT